MKEGAERGWGRGSNSYRRARRGLSGWVIFDQSLVRQCFAMEGTEDPPAEEKALAKVRP